MPRRQLLIELAFKDAIQLLDWRFGGLSISRRHAWGLGMGRRRWQRAVLVLHRAGVWNRVDVVVPDYAECLRLVEVVRQRSEKAGEYRWLFG